MSSSVPLMAVGQLFTRWSCRRYGVIWGAIGEMPRLVPTYFKLLVLLSFPQPLMVEPSMLNNIIQKINMINENKIDDRAISYQNGSPNFTEYSDTQET